MGVYSYMRVATAEQLNDATKKQKPVQKKQPTSKKNKKK